MISDTEILVVVPQAPWPARRDGYSVRYHPMLEHLSRRHQVDLCLINEFDRKGVEEGARTICRELFVLEAMSLPPTFGERWRTRLGMLNPWAVPYHIRKFASARIAAEVLSIAARKRYRTILWVSSEYTEAAAIVRLNSCCRFVLDLIDSPSLYYRRKPAHQAAPWVLRHVVAWQTRRFERRWRKLANKVVYITELDSIESGRRQDRAPVVIPNGLLLDETIESQNQPPALSGPPALGFLGHMGYEPNIAAVKFLHDRIFRVLKKRHSDLRLIIIGRAPAPSVRELAGDDVIVTGSVQSIWPYVRSVEIFVFPMTMGAGLQNKILEAMAAGRPVVTTSICAGPLGSEAKKYLTIADDADQFAVAVERLLARPAETRAAAAAAAEWVRGQFDWANILPRFEQTIVGSDAP
jgi:glycosyltransferase involved in cell wall biosynthesis